MNDSPVGCQSRLTEAASSRKKEPYRPHQAKPELVARLEVTSNGVIFFVSGILRKFISALWVSRLERTVN